MNIFHLCVYGVEGYHHLGYKQYGGVGLTKEFLKLKIRENMIEAGNMRDSNQRAGMIETLNKLLFEVDQADTPKKLEDSLNKLKAYKVQIQNGINRNARETVQSFMPEDSEDEDEQNEYLDLFRKQQELDAQRKRQEQEELLKQQELARQEFEEQERRMKELAQLELERQIALEKEQQLRQQELDRIASIPKYGRFATISISQNMFDQLISQFGPILRDVYLERLAQQTAERGKDFEVYGSQIDQFTPAKLFEKLTPFETKKSPEYRKIIQELVAAEQLSGELIQEQSQQTAEQQAGLEMEKALWDAVGEQVINQLNAQIKHPYWNRRFRLLRKGPNFVIEYQMIKPFAPFNLQVPVLPPQNPKTRRIEMTEDQRVFLAQEELVNKLEQFLNNKIPMYSDLTQEQLDSIKKNHELVLVTIPSAKEKLETFVKPPSSDKGPVRKAIYDSFINLSGKYWNSFRPMVNKVTDKINQDLRLTKGKFVIYVNNSVNQITLEKEINLRVAFSPK